MSLSHLNKPRIYLWYGRWYCTLRGILGTGMSAKEAYEEYHKGILTVLRCIQMTELYKWQYVPFDLWESTLINLSDKTPTSGGSSFHCFNNVYEFPGITWDITFEFGQEFPSDVRYMITEE